MKSIPLYTFRKKKYGSELLIDVISIDDMKRNIEQTPVLSESFYSILLVTGGREEIAVNGRVAEIGVGQLVCGIPGDVWTFQKKCALEGYNLIFEEEFLLSFFIDPHFLGRFAYLHPSRNSPFLTLKGALQPRIRRLFAQMKEEVESEGREKDQHILRAMLYETLLLISRAEPAGGNAPTSGTPASRHIDSFQRQVNADFATQHGPGYYAARLCITPNYLNRIVRQSLGVSTKAYIRGKIIREAKRLLVYTDLTITEITDRLHFENSSYFIRFFRKEEGCTPVQFRMRPRR